MTRKYTNYTIKVTYDNGDTEDISLKGINTSNYKEMLQVYSDVKEDRKNDSCIIAFAGVGDNGELGILFTKEIKNKISDIDRLNMKTEDISKQIQYLLETIKLKTDYHSRIVSVSDKKKNYIEHKFENYSGDNFGKVNLFNNLQDILLERRIAKNELRNLSLFTDNFIKSTLDGIVSINNKIQKINDENEKAKKDFLTGKIDEYNVIKEVTDKERLNLMKQLNPKYKKVVVDELNKRITFYNNGYGCNKKIV